MADARHFCPDCGNIDLQIKSHGTIITAEDGGSATCPNCSWSGSLKDTIGAVTTEQFWDAERVGDVLLRVLAVNGAGKIVQALEFIGLLPRPRRMPDPLPTNYTIDQVEAWEKERNLFQDPSTAEWNAAAQRARDAVMRKIMEGAITAGFEEAERQNRLFAIATDTQLHPMLQEETDPKWVDKKVTDIGTARRRKRKKRR